MKQLFLAVCLLVSAVGFAKIPQPQKNTYVNDFAGVLKPGDIRDLNAKIHRIERLADVQMAVVLINKLPAEFDIEEYALLIGRKWHVGKHKNGLVYVAAIAQHKQRLEVARLLSDKITDEKSAEILDAIKPFFRQQDYAGGINAMIDEVTAVVAPAKPAARSVNPVQKQSVQAAPKDNDKSDWFSILIGFVLLGGFFAFIFWVLIRIIRWLFGMGKNNGNNKQAPMGYNDGVGYNGPIIHNYGDGYRSSGMGSALGGFAAGYAARTIQDGLSDNYHHHHHHADNNYSTPNTYVDNSHNNDNDDDTSVNTSDQNSSSWGNWGSNSSDDSNSSSSSDDSSSSSSDSGYDGSSGATSDW